LDRVAGSLAGVREDVHEMSSQLSTPVESIREDVESTIREGTDAAVARVEEVARTVREVSDASVSRFDQLDRTLREVTEAATARFEQEHERRSASLERGLARVDEVADALSSLERRRGVRQLIEGEQRLVEQQDDMVRRVTERADLLAERMRAIEGEIGSVLQSVDQKHLSEEVSARVKEAVDELRETIAHDLGARFASGIAAISEAAGNRLAEDVGKRVEHLREELTEEATRAGAAMVDRASATVAEEIEAIRRKIDAWGKSRTSPKVAEQIASMDERLEEVSRIVREDLVDAVFDRMQRAFDRRFEVLVQLVETRVREAVGRREEHEHARRLFRRPHEEE
jgi:hypothetical protein